MIQYAMTTWSIVSSTGPGTGVSIAAAPVADGGGAVGAPAANADAGDMRFAVYEFPGVLDPLDGSPGIPGGSSSGGGANGRVGTPIDAVAHAFQPDTRGQALVLNIYSAIGGDIHFRPNLYNAAGNIQYPTGVDWYWDPTNPLHNPALPYGAGIGGKQIDLLTVIFHEVGHALGLGHDVNALPDAMSVMNPTYAGPRAGPSARDIASIQQLYIPAPGGAVALGLCLLAGGRRRGR